MDAFTTPTPAGAPEAAPCTAKTFPPVIKVELAPIKFAPGQVLEFTLPTPKPFDHQHPEFKPYRPWGSYVALFVGMAGLMLLSYYLSSRLAKD